MELRRISAVRPITVRYNEERRKVFNQYRNCQRHFLFNILVFHDHNIDFFFFANFAGLIKFILIHKVIISLTFQKAGPAAGLRKLFQLMKNV